LGVPDLNKKRSGTPHPRETTRKSNQNFLEDFFMMKKALLMAAFVAAGSTGFISAQTAAPTVNTNGRTHTKEMGFVRIVTLKDRIKNQRLRIAQGLTNSTLTGDQAAACSTILDNMENQMKAERAANGAHKIMTRDNYDAYNATLDTNSSIIHEQKQYFYYYGPYADQGPNYDYYYDAYAVAGAPTPSVSESTPRMFELRDRLAGQRARITRDLAANTLTSDQAKTCDGVLDSVSDQMKTDFTANGSHHLTMDQYVGLNAMLDANSALIQENRQYYYYYKNPKYDPNYDQTYTK
jgi:hypothetical protein